MLESEKYRQAAMNHAESGQLDAALTEALRALHVCFQELLGMFERVSESIASIPGPETVKYSEPAANTCGNSLLGSLEQWLRTFSQTGKCLNTFSVLFAHAGVANMPPLEVYPPEEASRRAEQEMKAPRIGALMDGFSASLGKWTDIACQFFEASNQGDKQGISRICSIMERAILEYPDDLLGLLTTLVVFRSCFPSPSQLPSP